MNNRDDIILDALTSKIEAQQREIKDLQAKVKWWQDAEWEVGRTLNNVFPALPENVQKRHADVLALHRKMEGER